MPSLSRHELHSVWRRQAPLYITALITFCIIVASVGFLTGCSAYSAPASQSGSNHSSPNAPIITWAPPEAVSYGTALGPSQLNATANVTGTFAYSPAQGALLAAGRHCLNVTFTPDDITHYSPVTASVMLMVVTATPNISWPLLAPIPYGTPLSDVQLNATASIPGTFAYSPAYGTLLNAGTHNLSVTFTPSDRSNYAVATTTVALTITPATPTVTWRTPTPIFYGMALSDVQLNATASIPGSYAYSPSAGTRLNVGNHLLSVTFTPEDLNNYSPLQVTVSIIVSSAVPVLITLTPNQVSMPIGQTASLIATALYSDGTTADITDTASWSSSQTNIVAFAEPGKLGCLKRGTTEINATLGTITSHTSATCIQTVSQQPFSTVPEEFVGPFASWLNVQAQFGAKGDGVTDDTDAIQMGLNAISPQLSAAGPLSNPVLWFPSGTYRITRTLNMAAQAGVALVGEDPTTTQIVWDGPQGGTIFFTQGVTRTRVTRLTINGSDRADTGYNITWDTKANYYPGDDSFTDVVFKGMNYGLRIGFAGPVLVERARFIGMSSAGISEEDWNASQLWVRDSLFTNCARGITNVNGAGNFHVYGSIFLGSTRADMEISNTQFFSIRGNTSIGSQKFFMASPAGYNSGQITIQDNLIVDPLSTPLSIGNMGPVMLIDNVILLPEQARFPVLLANDFGPIAPTDVLTIGNTFTTSNVLAGLIGRSMSIDDRFANRGELAVITPDPAPFRSNLHRKIIEVSPTWDTAKIQSALDQAALLAGSRPVVHFPAGLYTITTTLNISGGSDVQVVGDGYFWSSQLVWRGSLSGPILEIQNPARATLRDIALNGQLSADGIKVHVNDTPGSRILVHDVTIGGLRGIDSEGLDQAVIEARSTSLGPSDSAVMVVGGGSGQSGLATFGRYSTFGGGDATGTNGFSWTIQSGGQITVQDNWHEGPSINLVNLTDSGTITIQSGTYACLGPTPFAINGFRGDVSLIGYQATGNALADKDGEIEVSGDASGLRFLVFGVQGYNTSNFLVNSASGGKIGLVMSRFVYPGKTKAGEGILPDTGDIDTEFVRSMFSHIRYLHTVPSLPIRSGLTDVRFERMLVVNQTTGIHLVPVAPMNSPVLSYAIVSESGNATNPDAFQMSMLIANKSTSNLGGWGISHLDDGGYRITDIANGMSVNSALGLETTTGSSDQSWIIEPIGDGYFSVRNSLTGLFLTVAGSTESPTLLTLPEGEGNQSWRLEPVY